MTYKSIIVQATPDARAKALTEVAAALARRFGGRLIGLGAVEYAVITAPYYGFSSAFGVAQLMESIQAELEIARSQTEKIAKAAGVDTIWRRSMDSPASAMAAEARGADLAVVGSDNSQDRRLTALATDLVMMAGVPVLVVPPNVRTVEAATVLVAWKNTREARRAIGDALPFLASAHRVVLAAIQEERDDESLAAELDDVAERLRLHGISAEIDLAPRLDMSVPDQLAGIVASQGADLIVAGAYGHRRVQEWIFGGVTERLVLAPPVPALLSR